MPSASMPCLRCSEFNGRAGTQGARTRRGMLKFEVSAPVPLEQRTRLGDVRVESAFVGAVKIADADVPPRGRARLPLSNRATGLHVGICPVAPHPAPRLRMGVDVGAMHTARDLVSLLRQAITRAVGPGAE